MTGESRGLCGGVLDLLRVALGTGFVAGAPGGIGFVAGGPGPGARAKFLAWASRPVPGARHRALGRAGPRADAGTSKDILPMIRLIPKCS